MSGRGAPETFPRTLGWQSHVGHQSRSSLIQVASSPPSIFARVLLPLIAPAQNKVWGR